MPPVFTRFRAGQGTDDGSNLDGLSQGDRIVVTPFDQSNVPAVEKALAERNEPRPMDA